MVSLVFHGGHYKTGTTSLQHTLRGCEAGLAAAGVLYPRSPADRRYSDVQHVDLIADSFDGRYERVAACLSSIVVEAQEKNCKTVLLSAEIATSFHDYPDAFAHWSEITGRLFDDVRYVFVVRDALSYAASAYRELVKSGRASFHFEAVKGELLKQLCIQQRSIAFFRKWNAKRVTLLSYRELAAESLVRDLARVLVGYEVDPAIVAYLNSSQKKARNVAALLLNDIYALIGAQMHLEALDTSVRQLVKANLRGKLKHAFSEEFSARIEQAFLEVTEGHVRRVFESEQAAFKRSLARVPKKAKDWLLAPPPAADQSTADS